MNDQSNVPAARREPSAIEQLKATVARKANDFKMVLPSHITVDKFQRTIATAALSNPQILNCDRQSLLMAAMKLAQDGLLPDGREAALVPFKSRVKDGNAWIDKWMVQAMPMAWGIRKKILQSGMVISLETGVVYRAEAEQGLFLYELGIDPPIRHRPKLDITDEEMADENIVAAYSIARLKNDNGDPYWSVEVMRRAEINKVRQASQTGAVGKTTRDGKPIPPKGPWVDWFGEMARKTVLRRHSKVLPMSGDLLDTFERDDAEEARAIGAAKLLEAQEHGPAVLPSEGDLDDAGHGGEVIDQQTGEVLTDQRTGMTELDEDAARALDAAASNDDRAMAQIWVDGLEKRFAGAKDDAERRAIHDDVAQTISELEQAYPDLHERAMKAIPSYAEEGEGNPPATDGAADQGATNEEPIWVGQVKQVRTAIANAKTIKAVETIEREWTNKIMNDVADDEVIRAIDAELASKKRNLRANAEA